MKTPFPFLLCGVLIAAGTPAAVAGPDQQPSRTPSLQSQQPGGSWYTVNDSLAKKWALTEDQRTRLKEIDLRYEKLRADPNNTQRDNANAMMEQRDQEYMKVLNQSQFAQWQAYTKRMDAHQSSVAPQQQQPAQKTDPNKMDARP